MKFSIAGKSITLEELKCKDIYWVLVQNGNESKLKPTCIKKL